MQFARFWYAGEPFVAWTPRILTEYELGQASVAIESVARLGKPIAEVGSRAGRREDIEHDLRACLADRREARHLMIWIRADAERLRFGYYAEPWTQRALDFLDRPGLELADRHWICGLLFGYQPGAIQEFIDAVPAAAATASNASRPPIRTPSSNRTSHLSDIRLRSRR